MRQVHPEGSSSGARHVGKVVWPLGIGLGLGCNGVGVVAEPSTRNGYRFAAGFPS